ncbi:hypothetical protein AMS68_001144 [Peltaster fructicola]|uniref:holo-[acyl-carrier-protein] synthase n=1 Tax=Peltaster fructicola TaxID=286661 RepID=A0A6H0XLJ4_9PEZI|nr:hypothetical protein AMS68_001144 [Peltaster fructicola]
MATLGILTPPPSASAESHGTTTCWVIDTRPLWPGDSIAAASGAAKALALVSLSEQTIIMNKMFIADAKMSLASALIKRLWISKTLGIAWKEVHIARRGDQKHGKPCAVDEYDVPIPGIDFNVSHQNGLVTLIGYDGRASQRPGTGGYISNRNREVTVGTDIVCVNERDDYRTIDEEGLDGWVDIYDSIFSDEERWSMKYDVDQVTLLDGTTLSAEDLGRHDRCIARHKDISLTTPRGKSVTFSSEQLIDAKLRRFYAYFCYKESYIKLSGEALLAPWIKQCEFFNVRSPTPGTPARCSKHGVWGEEVDDVDVHLRGRAVTDVRMKLQAFEEDFMIGTAIQGDISGVKIAPFKELNMETDVMQYAQENLWSA